MEIIDLQADDRFKDKYKGGNLNDFNKFRKPKQFPNLKQLACTFVSIFVTTNLFEQTFSKMKHVKSNYRANLSDEHLKVTSMKFKKKKYHPSH